MSPHQYWLENGVKIFSLQFNFLRPFIYDLKTDETDPSFLTIAQKTLIIKHTLKSFNIPNYRTSSKNHKYTSPFTMTNLYTIDLPRITMITKL